MVIVTSQLIILALTVLFTIIALIAIYKYEANFYIKNIIIKDIDLTWSFITTVEAYYKWWDLFKNNTHTSIEIKILKNIELNQFKLYVKQTDRQAQVWTFYLNLEKNLLTIKAQILTNDYLSYFLAKYYLNSKITKNYIKNLEQSLSDYKAEQKYKPNR